MSIQHVTFDEALLLENGSVLEFPHVAYSTYGKLNKEKDNVIVVFHALTANSEVVDWWSGLFGSGKIFNPERDFILCINNLGSPYGSSSPKSLDSNNNRYGLSFPDVTIRDIVQLHLRLIQYLEIEKIRLLIGGSCGGNIAQEMAIILKNNLENLVVMCCSAYETPWVISIHESQRIVLESDPSFKDNSVNAGKHGLMGARAFALPFYRSHPSFKIRQSEEDIDKLGDFKASSYIRYQGKKFVDRYDAHCYYKQLIALDTHHIGRKRGGIEHGLGQIVARTLAIGFSTDLLIPVEEQQIIADLVPEGKFVEIQTNFGHDAFLIETNRIQEEVGKWLIQSND